MSNLKKQITSGVFYTASAKYIGVVISIVTGAVLARLLTPSEFGTVALVTVFISFFSILSNLGIGAAVIQNKSLTKKDLQSIFSFTLIVGCILSLIFYFSAGMIAKFYNKYELIKIIQLLALAVFFNTIQIVPYSTFLKNHKFKLIGIVTISIQLFTGIVAIIFAYKGYSYYALVYKSIIDGLLAFVAYYFLKPIKPALIVEIKSIKTIQKFASYQFLFNFINYFSRNSDNLLIGKFLGPTTLGFYDKAYQLMMMPLSNLTNVITPVLHPILSEYQNDKEKIFLSYTKVVNLLALVGFPLSVFLFFSAEEIITLLYGNQWMDSIPIFKILALTVGIQIVLSTSGSIFQAANRTDLLFVSGFLSAITMVGAILYGILVEKSILAVGYGLFFAFLINFFQGFYFLIVKTLDSSFAVFIKIFVYPLFIGIFLGLILYILSLFLIENLIISLAIKILISTTIFLSFLLFKKEYRMIAYDFVLKKLTQKKLK